MHIQVDQSAMYLDSQEVAEDRAKLRSASPQSAENQRWAISLKWSDNLVERGGFPSDEQLAALR